MTGNESAPLAPETAVLLRGVSTATASLQLLKRGIRRCFLEGVAPLDPALPRLVGPAYTLRFVPFREDVTTPERVLSADNPQRRAVEETPPGCVLVADCRREKAAGVVGDILATRMRERGVHGIVCDGGVRDADGVRRVGLPVFSAGPVAPANLALHHPVDCQVPIACGGVAVWPGDVVLGDGDGVVVIPRDLADEIARDGTEQERYERYALKRVEAGAATPGVYPAGDAARADYGSWVEAGEPDSWPGFRR